MFKISINILAVIFTFSSSEKHFVAADPLSGDVRQAGPGEYLFVVSVAGQSWINDDNPYGHVCGGALIKSNYVLTAAHCFKPKPETLENYWVWVGSNDLAASKKVPLQSWVTAKQWNANNNNNRKSFANDLALIQLKIYVSAPVVGLISRSLPKNWIGKSVQTAGWSVSNIAASRYMRKAELSIMGRRDCINNLWTAQKSRMCANQLQDNIICTNHTPLVTLHHGDSGSPIFVTLDSGEHQIIGVNSRSRSRPGLLRGNEEINLHVSVYYFKQFIYNVTEYKNLFEVFARWLV